MLEFHWPCFTGVCVLSLSINTKCVAAHGTVVYVRHHNYHAKLFGVRTDVIIFMTNVWRSRWCISFICRPFCRFNVFRSFHSHFLFEWLLLAPMLGLGVDERTIECDRTQCYPKWKSAFSCCYRYRRGEIYSFKKKISMSAASSFRVVRYSIELTHILDLVNEFFENVIQFSVSL